jgi:hypothetical protein
MCVEREGASDLRYYIYTPGGKLLYSLEAADNSRHDYFFDENGNTLFITDTTGTVIASYAYSPFGRILASCRIGGGSSGNNPDNLMNYTITGLNAATTYYWKVSVTDGHNAIDSKVRNFTTQ